MSEYQPLTRKGRQRDLLRFSRLEAGRESGGNVEVKALRESSIEVQCLVHFVEVKMTADLDRTVAGVFDIYDLSRASGLEIDFAMGGI